METIKENNYIKPLLRGYTGSKHKFLPYIEPCFPRKINTFVDMFCGGGSVSCNISGAEKIIINELQKPIFDFHRGEYDFTAGQIVNILGETIKKYDLRWDNEPGYYELKKEYNKTHNPILLILMAPLSFSGILSFNEEGKFTNSYAKGNNKDGEILTPVWISEILRYKEFTKIQKREFVNDTFEKFPIETLKPGDFVYCDPPYFATNARYNKFWGEKQLQNLFKMFQYFIDKNIGFGYSDMLCVNGEVNTIAHNFIKQNKNKIRVKKINSDYSNALDKKTKTTTGQYIEIYMTNIMK